MLSDEDPTIRTASDWLTGSSIPVTLLAPGAAPTEGTAYWVMDTLGRPAIDDLVRLSRAALILLPVAANAVELIPLVRMWGDLTGGGADPSRLLAVVTKAPPVGGVGQGARDQLRGLNVRVADSVIRRYAAHERALQDGLLVRDVTGDENAWADVMALAAEVAG